MKVRIASSIAVGMFLVLVAGQALTQRPPLPPPPKEHMKLYNYYGLPPNYVLAKGCVPNHGFHASPKDYPNLPHFVLIYFNNELIGFEMEVDPKQGGWKPWFDQPKGRTLKHPGMEKIPHYTQHFFIKRPPTLAECKKATAQRK